MEGEQGGGHADERAAPCAGGGDDVPLGLPPAHGGDVWRVARPEPGLDEPRAELFELADERGAVRRYGEGWRDGPKSLQMVTAAMKLKDAYSLEGKL